MHVRRSWKAMLRDDVEAERFARVWNDQWSNDQPLSVHPRAVGGRAILIRPRTTDAQVVDDTFVGLYHLPPIPLAPDACVLDLGANIGCTAMHLATLAPRGRVLAVEMDGGNAAQARRNLAPLGDRVHVLHAAAWDTETTIAYSGTEAWGLRVASLGPDPRAPGPPESSKHQELQVRAMPVEAMLEECRMPRVDYAKVDIEGAEAVVVTGGARWLGAVRMIKVEYHAPATRETIGEALAHAGFVVSDDPRHPRSVVGIRV
ncbi:MAG: FkbM family methyltransferase [Phycisphaerales bacterium]|nr:FkbM family methyltransferase [Phycisphaerales bacterium]